MERLRMTAVLTTIVSGCGPGRVADDSATMGTSTATSTSGASAADSSSAPATLTTAADSDSSASGDVTTSTSSSTSTTLDSADGWSEAPGECGDGIRMTNEECDGMLLDGHDCFDFGFTGGTLRCNPASCRFDTTMCIGGSTDADTSTGDATGGTTDDTSTSTSGESSSDTIGA